MTGTRHPRPKRHRFDGRAEPRRARVACDDRLAGRYGEGAERGRGGRPLRRRGPGQFLRSGSGERSGGVAGRHGKRAKWRADRGSGSIVMLGVGLSLLALFAVVATGGAATVARHQAESAADLGALAGAAHAVDGQQLACAAAMVIVTANAGSLVSCRLEALDLIVTVDVRGPQGWGTARASARAGPARSP